MPIDFARLDRFPRYAEGKGSFTYFGGVLTVALPFLFTAYCIVLIVQNERADDIIETSMLTSRSTVPPLVRLVPSQPSTTGEGVTDWRRVVLQWPNEGQESDCGQQSAHIDGVYAKDGSAGSERVPPCPNSRQTAGMGVVVQVTQNSASRGTITGAVQVQNPSDKRTLTDSLSTVTLHANAYPSFGVTTTDMEVTSAITGCYACSNELPIEATIAYLCNCTQFALGASATCDCDGMQCAPIYNATYATLAGSAQYCALVLVKGSDYVQTVTKISGKESYWNLLGTAGGMFATLVAFMTVVKRIFLEYEDWKGGKNKEVDEEEEAGSKATEKTLEQDVSLAFHNKDQKRTMQRLLRFLIDIVYADVKKLRHYLVEDARSERGVSFRAPGDVDIHSDSEGGDTSSDSDEPVEAASAPEEEKAVTALPPLFSPHPVTGLEKDPSPRRGGHHRHGRADVADLSTGVELVLQSEGVVGKRQQPGGRVGAGGAREQQQALEAQFDALQPTWRAVFRAYADGGAYLPRASLERLLTDMAAELGFAKPQRIGSLLTAKCLEVPGHGEPRHGARFEEFWAFSREEDMPSTQAEMDALREALERVRARRAGGAGAEDGSKKKKKTAKKAKKKK